LKGTFSFGKNASLPRQILVVLQFGFAIVLIAGTFVIVQQINMVQNRELGYDQDNVVSVWNTEDLSENYEILKTELLQSGVVEAVTRSNSRITDVNSNNFVDWPGKPEQLRVLFVTIATDYDYAKTMGIKMLQGRDFSKEFASDSNAIIINKAALDLMELEDPLNTKLGLWGDKRQLIGVIDNTIMGSPYEEIRPLFMIVDPEWIGSVTFRLKKTDNLQASLSTVQSIFEKHNPAYPFEYTFADQEFQRKFTQITLTKRLATIFAGLALFITGLGLFGLASFTAQQRTKEIGIRKVLGASVLNLMGLLTTQFAKLVTISFVLATPIAWYLLDKYLDRYTLRIDISFWIFPVVGLLALIFAVIVVSDQARRAATSNPVE
jgi:ABC-type antimicrobial peptide transport system permease subunit